MHAYQRARAALEAERDAKLAGRRQRLAELLESDEEYYRSRLLALQPTSRDRMEAMRQAAFRLKERNEAMRQERVDAKLYEQWKATCDEFRTADSQIMALEVAAARKLQILEKEQEKRQQRELDSFYQQMEREDHARMIARDEADRDEQQRLRRDLVSNLNRQLEEQVESRRLRDREEAELEQQVAMYQKERSDELDRREVDRLRRQFEAQYESEIYLSEQRKLREEQRNQRLMEERAELERIREQQKREAEAARLEQARASAQARAFHRENILLMEKEADDNAELDRLIAEFNAKVHAEEDAQRAREDAARKRLQDECLAHSKAVLERRLAEMRTERERDRELARQYREEEARYRREAAEEAAERKAREEFWRSMQMDQISEARQREMEAQRQKELEWAEERRLREEEERKLAREAELHKAKLALAHQQVAEAMRVTSAHPW